MIICLKNHTTTELGSKARNLFLLLEAGFSVPPFFCVDQVFREEEVLGYLAANFPDTASFSVRSCASLEDSDCCSFAGQFKTFLQVPREEVCMRIRDVLSDAERPEILSYCKIHKLDPRALTMHVIIQEMLKPDLSGILFTANPQGILNESVIVCGTGTGDQVVEDKTDTTTYYYHLSDQICYYEQTGASPLLTEEETEELIRSSRKIRALLAPESGAQHEEEFDIEFAIQHKRIYFLQARPITSIDKTAPVIILDNSNIAESYPGITLPLTQSFIREAYYQVFKSLLLHLTGEPETVARIDETLKHMVDVANGRVYYRISNWYDVLLFLPFSDRLIPLWQEMMGVKDKTVNSDRNGHIRRSTRFKVACSFFRLLFTCPREMDRLDLYFAQIIERFESLRTDTEENRTLLARYRELQDMTVKRWDITLVNDMYSFLFTGLLKSCLKAKHVPAYELAANRAVSGVQKLESMRPIEHLQKLASRAKKENRLSELKSLHDNEACVRYIRRNDNAFTRALQAYIQTFGDRNVEELKLESKTFRTDPILLIRCVVQCAETLSEQDCPDQETAVSPLTGLSAFLAGRAAVGIRNREKSRLHRGRLYGMMRSLVLQMGQNLRRQERITDASDVFWLYCEEIEAADSDSSLHLKEIIAGRKKEYDGYAQLPAYSRLIFSGKIADKHPGRNHRMRHDRTDDIHTGTACSPGIAEGEVLLIDNPSPLLDTKGKILVTKMTDPGWVFLIAPAKAIVSEKGSLLSHTAILARELKKPAVTGVEHITEYLRTGDRIRVDGDTGVVTILHSARSENTPKDKRREGEKLS